MRFLLQSILVVGVVVGLVGCRNINLDTTLRPPLPSPKPISSPQPRALVDIRPEKLRWRYDEGIEGGFALRNVGNTRIDIDPDSLPWVRLVDAAGNAPIRTLITSGDFLCGGCVERTIVHLKPGEEMVRRFRFETDPQVEGAFLMRNGEYFIDHPGIERTHGVNSEVRKARIVVYDAEQNPMATGAGTTVHVVSEGETLWSIAQKYYGNGQRYRDLYQANAAMISDVGKLPVGLELAIPNP